MFLCDSFLPSFSSQGAAEPHLTQSTTSTFGIDVQTIPR